MHEDEMLDEALPPSRSQKRREALDILKLAEILAAMSEAELARVPLEDDLREEIRRTRVVSSHGARKRQNQFLAKQLRKLDEESLEPIRQIIEHDRMQTHREAAAMHRLETWRDRLLDDGDAALNDFMAEYPQADRQRLRQLARNAVAERKADKPPHAQRELFRCLREIAAATPPAAD